MYPNSPHCVPQEFLTINELKEISALDNVDIGSHTVSHPYLTRLNDNQVMHELLDSKHFLEDVLGKPVRLFAYPHGDYDKRIRDLVEEAGYEIARNLIENGCNQLVIAGRDPQKGTKAEKNLSQTGANVRYLQTNLEKFNQKYNLDKKTKD